MVFMTPVERTRVEFCKKGGGVKAFEQWGEGVRGGICSGVWLLEAPVCLFCLFCWKVVETTTAVLPRHAYSFSSQR